MQLSLLPGTAWTPKATTKTVTFRFGFAALIARNWSATAQGSLGWPLGPLEPPQVSSPSVTISRYLLRHSKEESKSLCELSRARSAHWTYHSRKDSNELPIGVEPLAISGRLASSFKRRKVSVPWRLSLR